MSKFKDKIGFLEEQLKPNLVILDDSSLLIDKEKVLIDIVNTRLSSDYCTILFLILNNTSLKFMAESSNMSVLKVKRKIKLLKKFFEVEIYRQYHWDKIYLFMNKLLEENEINMYMYYVFLKLVNNPLYKSKLWKEHKNKDGKNIRAKLSSLITNIIHRSDLPFEVLKFFIKFKHIVFENIKS